MRHQLEEAYAENRAAFLKKDIAAIMALRTDDFHTITPDSATHDRKWMHNYTVGLLNGIKEWKEMILTIDSLTISDDTAFVIMSQYLDRIALRPDQQYHRVQTWATQREAWLRKDKKWLLWRVDQVHNQRRLVDGAPG